MEINNRTYLTSLYRDKDLIKARGGRYDPDLRRWYFTDENDRSLFTPWLEFNHTQNKVNSLTPIRATKTPDSTPRSFNSIDRSNTVLDNGRIYLNSKYQDKDAIRILGGSFDGKVSKWYITAKHDRSLFSKWLPVDTTPVVKSLQSHSANASLATPDIGSTIFCDPPEPTQFLASPCGSPKRTLDLDDSIPSNTNRSVHQKLIPFPDQVKVGLPPCSEVCYY